MSHGRNSEGWTLENGYPETAQTATFPRRAMSAGFSAGLFLVLTSYEQDLDYICRGPVQGYKVWYIAYNQSIFILAIGPKIVLLQSFSDYISSPLLLPTKVYLIIH